MTNGIRIASLLNHITVAVVCRLRETTGLNRNKAWTIEAPHDG